MHSTEPRAVRAPAVVTGAARHVRAGGVITTVELIAPGIIKVRRVREECGAPETASAALATTPDRLPPDCEWSDCEGRLSGRAGPLAVAVDPVSGLLTFTHAASGRGGSGILAAELDVTVSAPAGPQQLRFSARRDEHFYGLGQKVRGADDTSLSWRHRVRSFGPYGNAREKSCPGVAGQGNGNTTVPLLVSTAGYGLFLDNHFRHAWDFTPADAWSVEAAAGEHRYWFIYGPDPAGVLERYTRLTGRAPLPPRWALGLLQSKFGYRSWDEVHAAAREFRARGIPCDAIILDLYWFGGVPHFGGARRIGSLEWDTAAFPDPAASIAALARQGFRVLLIEEPYVDEALPAFREAADGGHLATGPDGEPAVLEKWWGRGALVDMTSQAARDWWWQRHRPLVAQGVAGWWADLGEPDSFDPDARYHGGATHAEVHNRFALEWARALHDGARADAPHRRVFQLTRAGYAGIQRYGAALWSNDVMTAFEWLAPQPAAGLNLGLSGVPWWGTDVGGFIGPVASEELYVRWFQFGAFSPVFRTHGQDRPTAPFEFGPVVERICAQYARLRYRLLPYLYTAAREAYDTGMPLMRALACEFPDDPVAADLGAQYLFGPSLMVAPVVEPGTERNVYLPAGEWVDFWTGAIYRGPTWLRRWPAPLDTVPLFVRRGAIIPFGPDLAWTGERPLDELTLRVHPGAAASAYRLYEDDGETTAYESGACRWTPVQVTPRSGEVRIEVGAAEGEFGGMPRERNLTIEAVLGAPPAAVAWNGCAIDWTWSEERSLATIRLGRVPAAERQTVLIRSAPGGR
jgi:alpha-glucosidase (family GH31 glycosyl hydrolase)